MDWYYTKDRNQVGPVSRDELIRKISTGEVSSNDYAWHDGAGDWQPISSFPQLHITAGLAGGPPPVGSNSPMPYSGAPAGEKTSGLAIASMCLGIGSIVLCGIFLSIPAVICGHLALSEIKRSGDKIAGKAMALVGLIIGYLVTLLSVALILFFVVAATKVSHSVNDYGEPPFATDWDVAVETMPSTEEEAKERTEPETEELVPETSQ